MVSAAASRFCAESSCLLCVKVFMNSPASLITASSSLCVLSDRARMAGICSIVEYALRFVVARFLVDLLPRAIANLLAISNAFERTIISDIFIVRDWEHGQSLTIVRRIFLNDVFDG